MSFSNVDARRALGIYMETAAIHYNSLMELNFYRLLCQPIESLKDLLLRRSLLREQKLLLHRLRQQRIRADDLSRVHAERRFAVPRLRKDK
ncbi:hypothetical protein [Noviherbaspirillum pedocola]|uniref:Uncharacterized protein n=1 Tax=Noviherbaspirillum pedocola TaxID=2801341 RepID=A0A934WAJ3_9BURK|nr:hypothetical protein [Noviherbaspirillum pedocola]MBK4739164.1 hypothetical protein [Noviherbaspirillum pedocola]